MDTQIHTTDAHKGQDGSTKENTLYTHNGRPQGATLLYDAFACSARRV